MAFFSSKSYDRDRRTLKRTYSTDRDRDRDRERQHGPSRSKTLPATSEFGVIMENGGGAAYSAAFPSAQMSPSLHYVRSGSLFVPPSAISPPSSTSHYPYLSTPKTSLRSPSPASAGASSGSTSKRTSRSPNPSRRRVQQHDGVPSPRDGSDAGHSSHSNTSNKKNEAIARARSSPDVRAERVATKPRSKASLRSHAPSNTNSHDTEVPPASSSTPPRPPRSTRPPDSALESLPSRSTHASSSPGPSNLLHESSMFPSKSSSSSAALSSSYTSLGRQRPSHSPFPSASSRDQMDSMLVPPPKGYKPSGSVSDNSYGAPLSELGVGINMKRLLSKPAASSSIGAGGRTLVVRSEPDMDYGYNLLSAPRRRVETSSVNSLNNMSLSSASAHTSPTVLRDGAHQQLDFGAGAMRKPATSDPEPRFNPGSIGRARGLEWGHVLDPEKERERERGRSGRAHMRNHSSSFSLSSPSEGASAGYPIGLAFERERERVNASNGVGGATRPQIQLTTSAVRRFSALGAREVDSPVTPITFASSVSSANLASRPRSRQQQTPSPLAQAGVARRKNSPPPPGLDACLRLSRTQYKQQERRRAELARDASKDIEQPEKVGKKEGEKAQKSVRGRDRSARSVGGEGVAGHDDEDVTTPYYTVFGNPTERTVAIGTEHRLAHSVCLSAGESASSRRPNKRWSRRFQSHRHPPRL
ncbi:hypothetical protein DFH11DRAFT_1729798 [Phellopilus nigrolimitatus]|nr:hypothetical protein DFH11DRAFT_1729798 [Phellopilus nigrolimitatus]